MRELSGSRNVGRERIDAPSVEARHCRGEVVVGRLPGREGVVRGQRAAVDGVVDRPAQLDVREQGPVRVEHEEVDPELRVDEVLLPPRFGRGAGRAVAGSEACVCVARNPVEGVVGAARFDVDQALCRS
jgi:hypothetical protein